MKLDAERHGMEPAICNMLESRNIITTLSGETSRASAAKGCPQVGVLSSAVKLVFWMTFFGSSTMMISTQ
jgi:hypothetical protein